MVEEGRSKRAGDENVGKQLPFAFVIHARVSGNRWDGPCVASQCKSPL
jgi:hypothetical protein